MQVKQHLLQMHQQQSDNDKKSLELSGAVSQSAAKYDLQPRIPYGRMRRSRTT